ncbi:hypothetical protein JIM95_007130 [Corynebacterium sp. CCM 8835]|uniref:Integral membrane protein n=1 Tax=Corynebacterium antarcticum TaxID=2800405 RepID=A0A9Q4CCK8_9CORY|nr:hypothetical protein [Corynebacterium antarcticum]MCK7642152.1 hypothetical protein [Corynebacterium antarcticum]MCL0245913.1 hypothetical protein [Corynebacterium antarcticum]MCX7491629.1 hypothetical protein [Corynebacterium antarcticum]MCX7538321.1 hypothetical protein [Corynebacterium antarcticum]MCX7540487.1 hypothetical protein [Corynebacterium antarcticum]
MTDSHRDVPTSPSVSPETGDTAESRKPPADIRRAGVLGICESLVGLAYAVFLVFREITGQHDYGTVTSDGSENVFVGYGTAAFFVAVFGTVAAAGFALRRGRRWGRGPVVILQMLLLPVSWYIASAGLIVPAVIVAACALTGLYLTFNGRSLSWAAGVFS